jgi:hypothetical protein
VQKRPTQNPYSISETVQITHNLWSLLNIKLTYLHVITVDFEKVCDHACTVHIMKFLYICVIGILTYVRTHIHTYA